MIRTLLVVTALLLAGPASAQDSKSKAAPPAAAKATKKAAPAGKGKAKGKEPAPPPLSARERYEQLKAQKQQQGGAAGARSGAADPDAGKRAAAHRAKANYIFAVETCETSTTCDPALRDDMEVKFMRACRACAPEDRCVEEREAIQAGRATRSVPPCLTGKEEAAAAARK